MDTPTVDTFQGGNRRCKTVSPRPIVRTIPRRRGSTVASGDNMMAWGKGSLGRSTWVCPYPQVGVRSSSHPRAICVLDPDLTFCVRLSASLLQKRRLDLRWIQEGLLFVVPAVAPRHSGPRKVVAHHQEDSATIRMRFRSVTFAIERYQRTLTPGGNWGWL